VFFTMILMDPACRTVRHKVYGQGTGLFHHP
jgi:hypothetical protein